MLFEFEKELCFFELKKNQDANEGMDLYWGTAADGSLVISDKLEVIKAGCAKSFAPFPPGNEHSLY